jgi:hypothetical protein
VKHQTETASIMIVANASRWVWAYESNFRGLRGFRTAGRAPSNSTPHTILAIALVAALSAIGNNNARSLADDQGRKKPLVIVDTEDRTFGDAITGAVRGNADAPTLRVAKSLHRELARQVMRFDLIFRVPRPVNDAGDTPIRFMKQWANKRLRVTEDFDGTPAIFLPAVVQRPSSAFNTSA